MCDDDVDRSAAILPFTMASVVSLVMSPLEMSSWPAPTTIVLRDTLTLPACARYDSGMVGSRCTRASSLSWLSSSGNVSVRASDATDDDCLSGSSDASSVACGHAPLMA